MPILSIDQGTTSSRAVVFADDAVPVASAQIEITQHYPAPGLVEHDPAEILASVVSAARAALERAGPAAAQVAALGLTNQRETTVIWDRDTGKPIHRAIVWQDRRTADICDRLRADAIEPLVSARTGLLLDPYFAATKIAWILDNVPDARARAKAGKLAFGTVDSFLVWHLTRGRVHATDATNAARTALYDIARGTWDHDLCRLFDVPMALLPEVRDCNADFGTTDLAFLGRAIAIRGVAGDQQAAAMGQACFAPGMMKSTYGTGCFALLHTGTRMIPSANRLLTTIAARLNGQVTYALEGAIFNAGTVVQWLRDGLGLIDTAADTATLAASADPDQDILLVPAFTGLGAPWWAPGARGAIHGLTRNTGPAELARAALESVGFQTSDLWRAMQDDWTRAGQTAPTGVLRVDGGMSASDPAMQFLADILDAPVDRPRGLETTALGAAWLAGSAAGVWPDQDGFARQWTADRRFTPAMDPSTRQRRLRAWNRAVAATIAAAGD